MKFRGNNGLQGVCGWYGISCSDWRSVWKIVDRDRPIEEGRRKKTIGDGKGRNLTRLSPEEHHRPLNSLHHQFHVLTCLASECDGSAYTSVGEMNSTESIPRPGQRAVYLNWSRNTYTILVSGRNDRYPLQFSHLRCTRKLNTTDTVELDTITVLFVKVYGNFAVDGGFSFLIPGQPYALRGNDASMDLRKHGSKVVLDSCCRQCY